MSSVNSSFIIAQEFCILVMTVHPFLGLCFFGRGFCSRKMALLHLGSYRDTRVCCQNVLALLPWSISSSLSLPRAPVHPFPYVLPSIHVLSVEYSFPRLRWSLKLKLGGHWNGSSSRFSVLTHRWYIWLYCLAISLWHNMELVNHKALW